MNVRKQIVTAAHLPIYYPEKKFHILSLGERFLLTPVVEHVWEKIEIETVNVVIVNGEKVGG